MARAKHQNRQLPRPLGYERLATLSTEEVVEALGVAHLARAAYWRLVEIGPAATPAVTPGLRHANPLVRKGCCDYFDLYWSEEATDAMQPLLADPDPDVRWMAAHALSCERCKTDAAWEKRARERTSTA